MCQRCRVVASIFVEVDVSLHLDQGERLECFEQCGRGKGDLQCMEAKKMMLMIELL